MDILIDILNLGNSDTWIVYLAACLLSFLPFATLGFLFSKHREEEPSYLISLDRVKGLKNAWTLLLLIIAPLIFIYNVFVWSAYAFVVVANFIAYLIKSIYDLLVKYIFIPIWSVFKWIFNAIIWVFWNIIWIPIKIIFKSLYHYCILWTWDLYKTSFFAINGTYDKNRLRVTFMGAFYALAIIGFSIYLSILFNFLALAMIGLIVATLPTLKAFGTATSMLHHSDNREHSTHGKKAMKTGLNYIIGAIIAIVVIELMLLFSWIPDLGLVFLGIAVNTNVFLSAIVILSLIVLLFAGAIIPNHLLYNDESISMKDSARNYLLVIRDKGLQLLLSLIPGSLWTALVLILPAALIYLSISTSESFKKSTLSLRADQIVEDIADVNKEVNAFLSDTFSLDQISDVEAAFEAAIELNVRSNQNTFGLDFPKNVIDNSEIIFDDNTTEYTNILPEMLAGAINDTLIIANKIKESELLISNVTNHISEYNNQQWEFRVQRKDRNKPKQNWTTISSGTDISRFVDKNIAEGKSYIYRVMVVNSNGKSSWSSEYNKIIGEQILRSPSELNINSEYNFNLIFSWNDNSDNEDGFTIERRESGTNDEWFEYAMVGPDISQHVIHDGGGQHVTSDISSPGKKYDYRVLARGLGGKSKPTNVKSYKVTLSPPNRLMANANLKSALLDWTYRFGYDTNEWQWINPARKEGSITPNKLDGIYALGEKSLAEIMQNKIDEEKNMILQLNRDLELAKARVAMFASLIDYDRSQRIMLKIFKNFAFIFAILFTALFGGMIIAIAMSYLTALFHKVFTIRENDAWYLMSLVNEEKSKNKNQPLLAFTFWFIFILLFSGGTLVSGLI
tara:strand:+ start:14378 stop:16921 length:2544 start_codon:yes stop_codon:yes gene_type:complete